MHIILKNILAIIIGVFVGSAVNMGIIMISGSIISPPDGADVTTMEGLKESIHLFQPKHFLFPFFAHAIGTFVGAFLASLVAVNRKLLFALVIGIFFLIGGIANIFMLPSPSWFVIVDLAGAYIPMAWLGWKVFDSYIGNKNL